MNRSRRSSCVVRNHTILTSRGVIQTWLAVCDAYYLQHIVEFITDGSCETLILHTDNSAVRMLSLKFGVGRLRHIRGRMFWLQQKMSNYELDIRQVPTLQNIADLNAKGHGKHRFLSSLYMFGFVTSKVLVLVKTNSQNFKLRKPWRSM